jgi:glutamate:Na+ symporter, ESS family
MGFWEFEIWSGMLQFGLLSVVLLLANTLRRKVPFLRKSLLPTAVLGGFIIFIVRIFGVFDQFFDNNFLDMVVYHTIAIGFISLGLKTNLIKNSKKYDTARKDGFNSGLIIVGSYLVQGIVGLTLTIIMAATIFPNLFPAAGIILPLGFGQGPGQANNFGTNYEIIYNFVGGKSWGLSIASLGFVWATIPGVIYLSRLKKEGKLGFNNAKKNLADEIEQIHGLPDEIPLAEAIDKFTVQVSLVMLVFVTTFAFMYGIDQIFLESGMLGTFGINTLRPLIWGFNFIFGTLFALLYKQIFNRLKEVKLMTHSYTNNFMLNRIAGFVFDYMIIASIALINIQVLTNLWLPLLIVTSAGGLVSFVYLRYISKIFYSKYELEGFLSMYGTMTGTASTGIALLREADPNFETPAANNLVIGSTGAIAFGFPLLLLLGFAPSFPLLVLGLLVVFCALILGLLFREQIWKRFKKTNG